MKIGLIVDEMDLSKGTGTAKYSRALFDGLIEEGLDVTVFQAIQKNVRLPSRMKHLVSMPMQVVSGARKVDILHATTPVSALALPLVRSKKVVTFHDLCNLQKGAVGRLELRRKCILAAYGAVINACDRILVNSSQTKADLHRQYGVVDKLDIVPLAADDNLGPCNERCRGILGFIGANVPRKRLDYAISVVKLMNERYPGGPFELHVFGPGFNGITRADGTETSCFIKMRGFVQEREKGLIYHSMDCLLYPSECEGFGLPILEAQRCGIPVLVREGTHIPLEVTEGAIKVKSEGGDGRAGISHDG